MPPAARHRADSALALAPLAAPRAARTGDTRPLDAIAGAGRAAAARWGIARAPGSHA